MVTTVVPDEIFFKRNLIEAGRLCLTTGKLGQVNSPFCQSCSTKIGTVITFIFHRRELIFRNCGARSSDLWSDALCGIQVPVIQALD